MLTGQEEIFKLIQSKVYAACELPCFLEWQKTNILGPDDFVLINNSFFFRYKVETNKNTQFLSLKMGHGPIEDAEIRVISGISMNSDFKHLNNKYDIPANVALIEAIQNELQHLGRLVFMLVGNLDDSLEFRQQIQHSMFNQLILRPQLDTNLTIDGKTIFIKNVISEELIWNELEIKARESGLAPDGLPSNLLNPFSNAIKELRKNSYINLALPERGSISGITFLDSITNAMRENSVQYRESLEKWQSASHDQQEFNNILRIAYNFSGEAITILRLLVSICDLKPLVLWMTIKEQIELAEAFRNLPWARTKDKPSLDDYVELIHGARNRSFHNLLPFNRTIMAQLEGVPITARYLRLFPEYSSTRSKTKNTLEYDDRQLVEILTEFTRAEQKYVSPDFWQRNLNVLNATCNLLAEVTNSLKTLNRLGN